MTKIVDDDQGAGPTPSGMTHEQYEIYTHYCMLSFLFCQMYTTCHSCWLSAQVLVKLIVFVNLLECGVMQHIGTLQREKYYMSCMCNYEARVWRKIQVFVYDL